MTERKSPIRKIKSQRGNCPWIIWLASKHSKRRANKTLVSGFFFRCCRLVAFLQRRPHIVLTERWAHTPEERWQVAGSWAVFSSSCPLCPGPRLGCTAGAAPLSVSDGCRNPMQRQWREENILNLSVWLQEWIWCAGTFITLKTLQLHGFLLHFRLSSGLRELSRMWAVDAEFGKSDPYSVPGKHMHVVSSDNWLELTHTAASKRALLTIVMLNGSVRQKGNLIIRWVRWVIVFCKNNKLLVVW